MDRTRPKGWKPQLECVLHTECEEMQMKKYGKTWFKMTEEEKKNINKGGEKQT